MSVDLNKNPRDSRGVPISAPTFEDTDGLAPGWEGYLYTVTAGQTNIWDELVTVEKRLRGGWYEILDDNAVIGDYIEFAVVDKDNVLGLFGQLGLTVGEDVLELRKYVKKDYVNPRVIGRHDFRGNSTFPVCAGLYLRSIYVSTGQTDINLKVVTFAYE